MRCCVASVLVVARNRQGGHVDGKYLGELAALGTATMWAFSSIAFTAGGRRVGSVIVNRTRLVLAVLFIGVTHWLLIGRPFPWDATPQRFVWLGLSGIVGLVVGDSMLFQCYVLVGPRIGVLLYSLSPLFSTTLAWIFLHETLTLPEIGAIALALAGVTSVVLERGKGGASGAAGNQAHWRGIVFGLGAALCQAIGLVIAKRGLTDNFPALSATMIRMTTGMLVMWLLAALSGEAGRTIRKVRGDRRAALAILAGSFVGPFIGVWLSLIAIQSTQVAIASTLIAMTPVISLPLVPLFFKERVSPRAVFGTLVAMTGVALMILI
jgi:drug/metabolite transporter (DMT)-like permease